MLALIGLTSFLTVVLLVLALGLRSPRPARVRARQLSAGAASHAADAPLAVRLFLPAGQRAGQLLTGMLPTRLLDRLDRMLIAAGEPVRLETFVIMWCVSGVTLAGVVTASFGARWLLPALVAGLLLPWLLLRGRLRGRRTKIVRSLPDMLDLLVTCVEAGLGLDAALVRVAEVTRGPLGDELHRTMREIAVGRQRQEALLDLGKRTGVQELDSVIRPVVQAERSGVSIAAALRVQADGLRTRRRQRAQEAAQKMAVKMMLPVAIFFMPATLLIAVAPAVFSFIDFFREL